MSDINPLISIPNFSAPVTALIEKLASGAGILYEPRRIRQNAKAQRDADLIAARTELEIEEFRERSIAERAMARIAYEEIKKQQNIDSITSKAIPLLEDKSRPQDINDDWLTNFFDKGRLISDDDMQTLWAKVLAGEANSPGQFSKRTVNMLASLDKNDAEIFQRLCSFVVKLEDRPTAIVFQNDVAFFGRWGIDFDALNHLDSIGLITFSEVYDLMRTELPQTCKLLYRSLLTLELPEARAGELTTGNVLLTKSGEQLAIVCEAKKLEEFESYLIKRFAASNIAVSSPYPQVNTD